MTVVIKVEKNSLQVHCSTKDYEMIRSSLLEWADEQAYKLNTVLIAEEATAMARQNGGVIKSIGSENLPPRESNEFALFMRDLGYDPVQQADFLFNFLRLQFPTINIVVNK